MQSVDRSSRGPYREVEEHGFDGQLHHLPCSVCIRSHLTKDKHNLIALQIINHYDIANKVPPSNTITFESLAQSCNLPQEILTRIIRQAMTFSVFSEPQAGHVAHTQTSLAIPSQAPLLNYQLEICLPSSTNLLKSLDPDTKKDQEKTAFQLAHNTTDNWFDFAAKSGTWMEEYGKYQSLIAQGGAHDISHLVHGYDWAALGKVNIIDIGGGDGSTAFALAQAHPNLHITVQDFADLLPLFERKRPGSLASRVKFIAHSFFDPQPDDDGSEEGEEEEDGEETVFLLRHILHDWPTEDGHRILRNLIPGMKAGGRKLIVAEQVMPRARSLGEEEREENESSSSSSHGDGGVGSSKEGEYFTSGQQERVMRALDMQMMVQYGSQERTMEDWKTLFAAVGLKVVKTQRPGGSADTIMEIGLE